MKSDKQIKRKRARMEETTTPKKPTSRTRSRNASASSAAAAGGGASHSAAALGESKIVWKDSPVEKHIKVSGTGKYVPCVSVVNGRGLTHILMLPLRSADWPYEKRCRASWVAWHVQVRAPSPRRRLLTSCRSL